MTVRSVATELRDAVDRRRRGPEIQASIQAAKTASWFIRSSFSSAFQQNPSEVTPVTMGAWLNTVTDSLNDPDSPLNDFAKQEIAARLGLSASGWHGSLVVLEDSDRVAFRTVGALWEELMVTKSLRSSPPEPDGGRASAADLN